MVSKTICWEFESLHRSQLIVKLFVVDCKVNVLYGNNITKIVLVVSCGSCIIVSVVLIDRLKKVLVTKL